MVAGFKTQSSHLRNRRASSSGIVALHAGDSREEALRMDEEVSLHIKNHAAKGVKRLEERLARFAEQRFCFVVTKVMQG